MAKRFLGKLAFPPPDPEFDTVEQSVYTDDVTHELVIVNDKTNQELYRIGVNIPNNPFDFYLDGNVSVGGDGSVGSPFKTITELNNAVLLLDPLQSYVGNVAPFNTGYGAEVVGTLLIAPNLSLIGQTPQNTDFSCAINLVATINPVVNQYRNLSFNGSFNLDLALASFASITFQNGAIILNRTDNNPSAIVSLQGGIGASTISGTVLINGGIVFGDITVNPASNLFCSNLFNLGGVFRLNGNCTLKTLGTLNPTAGYVDGTVVGLDTPVWLTDAASDEAFTGAVNKTVY